jgi:integrase
MVKIRLKRLYPQTDRHGKRRFYVRLPGQPAIPVHGEPGSAQFLSEYNKIMDRYAPSTATPRLRAGSVAATITLYLNSADYLSLAPSTRADRRRILNDLAQDPRRGHLPFAQMGPVDVEHLLAEKAAAPHAAKSFLKALRAMAAVAVKLAVIEQDPTRGIKVKAPISENGFRMWEESDIAQFEARWPIGSRERLALGLLLYSAQRRGDVILMGRQHIRDGRMTVRQSKTGAHVRIPLHPQLQTILASSKLGQLTFLTITSGKPFAPNQFTNWFGYAVRAAGLPLGLSAHGLRKAACRRLAEAGCTVHEIQAISGHKSLREVERYTKGVEQERLAQAAMDRVCKLIDLNSQTTAQSIENIEEGRADVSLVWTRTSSTSPSASTARQR